MHLTGIDRFLWVLGLLLHGTLLAVLFARRRAARFPAFTSLIAFNVLRTVTLYFVLHHGSESAYFNAYWTAAIGDVALQFAIAWEVATKVFQPLGVWAPDFRRSFAVLLGIGVGIAVAITLLATPATSSLRLAIAVRGDFFCSVLLSEFFVAIVALSVTMGLPWRTHISRIAQGLGGFALFGILTDAALTWFGSTEGGTAWAFVSHLQIEVYSLCVCYWIVTLSMPEPQPRRLPAQLHDDLVALSDRMAMLLRDLRITGSTS